MSSLIGLISCVACVLISIFLAGDISAFYDGASVFIVIGGTFTALIASYPMPLIKDTLKSIKFAFKADKSDPADSIKQIIDLANIARRDGLLALEDMLQEIPDQFLKKGIMLVVDGSNSELVRGVLETEMFYIQDRHAKINQVLNAGMGYSPSFGMAGTLIGLIVMLGDLSDSDALGPAMAVALITTFYGVLLANLFFGPVSRKLKMVSSQEQLRNEMIIEGILSIQDGEPPRMIRDKLESFISAKESASLEAKMNEGKSGDE